MLAVFLSAFRPLLVCFRCNMTDHYCHILLSRSVCVCVFVTWNMTCPTLFIWIQYITGRRTFVIENIRTNKLPAYVAYVNSSIFQLAHNRISWFTISKYSTFMLHYIRNWTNKKTNGYGQKTYFLLTFICSRIVEIEKNEFEKVFSIGKYARKLENKWTISGLHLNRASRRGRERILHGL